MAQQTAAVASHDDHPEPTLGVGNNKLGMWVFIASECLFFGAMIATYLVYLQRTGDGPTATQVFDIPFTSISTFILLMSSLGMVLALSAIQRGDMRAFRVWTLATALMGLTFLSGQIYEFTAFVAYGLGFTTSPFSASFYLLTGFHGVHVSIGVLMLLSLWAMSFTGRITPAHDEAVENVGLYWHFVDIIWILIFTIVYLIPVEGGL